MQTVDRRGASLKSSMPDLIHFLSAPLVNLKRMPAWSNWWVYVARKVMHADLKPRVGPLEWTR